MKKNVLVDFSHLDEFCGHGEIARNYAPLLAKADAPDLHFVFLVPERFKGTFGDGVDYVRCEHFSEDMRSLPVTIDLWHATDQQFKRRVRRRGCVQLLTVHDLNFLTTKTGIHRLRHIIELKWRVRRSDCVVTISKFVRDDLRRFMDTGSVPVKVIYNGIGDVASQPRRKPSFVCGEGEKMLVSVGRLRERKNLETLIPMMQFLFDYHLYICGNDRSAYARKLRQMTESLGLTNVTLPGEIEDAEKNWLYAHAKALLFPSKMEGFGLPLLEAMRFRCQVFSSRFSCMPEICDRYATYFDDYAPEAMASLVREGTGHWDKDSSFAREMQAYSESFNYPAYAAHYLSLYRQLLGLGE